MNAIMMLHRAQAGYLAAQGGGGESKYIKFADPAVEAVLMAKGVGDGIGITVADAEAVTDIGTWFKGNTEITSFDEFEKFTGVTWLDSRAFTNCTSLTSITIPRNVTKIDGESNYTEGTFSGCTSLTTLTFESDDTLLEIGMGCFANTANIVDCIFPKSIKRIGYGAFRNSFLRVVSFPNLETLDGSTVFSGSPIERVENIGKVTAIPTTNYEPFFGGNITFVRLPETMQTIGYHSFYGVKKLTTFICEAITPPSLDAAALTNASTSAITFYVPDASVDAYRAATNWNAYKAQIKSVFYHLGYIEFASESVAAKCIELYGSDGKVTIEQAQAVTTIENIFGTAISGEFTELRHFTNATSTASSALRATKLTSISFPESITSLGWGTCYQCSQLSVVTIYATTPPTYGANSFTSCAFDLKIYVPDESVTAYKEATGWVALADIIFGISEKQ